jgi:hypothetical protein
VETILEGHKRQILKIGTNPSMLRDMLKEFDRLEGFYKTDELDDNHHIDNDAKTRDDYFILEEDFFSSQPPKDPTKIWMEAGEAFYERWDTCL